MARTHRFELYKMADFFHLKMSEFLSLLFSESTHTCTDMDFTKWLICFISKCLNFYPCFFSENTHARTDIDVIKMADFSSLFFLKTRTHAQIWIVQNGWFVSSQHVWIFIFAFFENTHTRTDIYVIKMADFSYVFFFKLAYTHRL